ncbi:DUF1540 domain-containing protein [uncultured Clostridium sp.]|uniref:DUF1540 domain-containing protein n=1 Tax=uncultured Clostridium sp. TaxID=59620 RepID=UPI0025E575BE|nr:DUF1540 domain-containing protein [uncultured Clostridium sp.]
MSKIVCSVNSCSHNKENICYANRVNIGGKSAEKDEQTCCGSFLNKLLYSDLTNNTNSNGECDALVCFATSCKHNCESLCNLDRILVDGSQAEIYTETMCSSFDPE